MFPRRPRPDRVQSSRASVDRTKLIDGRVSEPSLGLESRTPAFGRDVEAREDRAWAVGLTRLALEVRAFRAVLPRLVRSWRLGIVFDVMQGLRRRIVRSTQIDRKSVCRERV